MNHLNIETSVLLSHDFLRIEPVERAIWLALLAYCVQQENGGVLKGAEGWKDFDWWMRGIDPGTVPDSPTLWSFEDGDLHLHHYPIRNENWVKMSRAGGAKGGRPKKHAKKENPEVSGKDKPTQKPIGSEKHNLPEKPTPETYSETKCNVRKGNVRKRKSTPKPPSKGDLLSLFVSVLEANKLPESVCETFERKYADWIDYRDEDVGKPVTERSVTIDAGRCCRLVSEEGIPPATVVNFFDSAIATGGKWQGWYFEDAVERARGEKGTPRRDGVAAGAEFDVWAGRP